MIAGWSISPYLHSLLLSNNVRYLHRPLHWKSPVLALPVTMSTPLLGQQRPSALSKIMRRGLLWRSDATRGGLPSSWLGNTSSYSSLPPMTIILSFCPWSLYIRLLKLLEEAASQRRERKRARTEEFASCAHSSVGVHAHARPTRGGKFT